MSALLAPSDVRELPYQPRQQFIALHQRNERWACIVAHRRAGKTVACVAELVIRALYSHKHNPRYAYVAPLYSQAKAIAWTYLKDMARPFIASAKDIRESELSVTLLNGATIRLYGSDNPDSLRGIYLDGLILDEYGDCRPGLWGEVLLPTLMDRHGWAVFIGTIKGKNHFYQVWQRAKQLPNWYELMLKASQSGILPAEALDEMRAQMTDEEWEQEMECNPNAAVRGTYYASQISKLEERGHILAGIPEHVPGTPVHAALDLGRKDSTAIWFWHDGPEGPDLIDYEEFSGHDLVFYFDLLDAKGYEYGTIWLPQDAEAKTLATKRSTIEQFWDPPQTDQFDRPLDYHRAPYPVRKVPNLRVQQGIDAARMILPYCRFNLEHCFAGIEALRAYRRRYDDIMKRFVDTPLHDWASDGADAFRYFALVCQQPKTLRARHERAQPAAGLLVPSTTIIQPPGYTLDALFSDRERTQYTFERMRLQ